MWHRWLLVQPARCGAPGVVLVLHTVVCVAKEASGWVFASLLFPSCCFCLIGERTICSADSCFCFAVSLGPQLCAAVYLHVLLQAMIR